MRTDETPGIATNMETTAAVGAKTALTGVRGWLAFFCFTLFLRAGIYLVVMVKLVLAQKPENVLSVLVATVGCGVGISDAITCAASMGQEG